MKKIVLLLILLTGWTPPAFAADLMSVQKALTKVFPDATVFEAQKISLSAEQISRVQEGGDITINGTHSSELIVHAAKEGQNTLGYAFEDTVFGKWGPIH